MGTLKRGFPLMIQQVNALVKKNLWLAMRSKRSSFLQLVAPFIFLLFLFAVDKVSRYSPSEPEVRDPKAVVSPSIPPCETKFHIRRPCYDFVWSGDSSDKAQDIVSRIMASNPGRPIPSHKVISFRTPADVDAWLFRDPSRCPAALHLVEKSATVMGYGIQTNYTTTEKSGNIETPVMKFQIPLQIAVERELARSVLAETLEDRSFTAYGLIAPLFFFTVSMFPFVFQMSSIVLEKELKLRQAMNIMGLYDSAYWLSWLVWETFVILISSLCIILSGMILQFQFFLHNSFAVLFFLFFLFQLNMTGFAFLLSAFLGKTSSAYRAGFWIFLIGIISQFAALAAEPSKKSRKLYFLPPALLSHALEMLNDAVESHNIPVISWSKRVKCPAGQSDCYFTMNDIYIRLLYTFVFWFILALYLDNVMPSPNGTRKSLLYFLNLRYWIGKGENKPQGGLCGCSNSDSAYVDITPDDTDVLEEEIVVKQQMKSNEIDSNIAVQIRGLVKIYPGKFSIGCCCKCQKTDPFHAIKGLYVNLPTDQLFCLLGPNGAGKTTTINCLTGITSVTAGDALIYGNSIRNSAGMSNIRKIIGLCPQFDVLWNELTGEEHLQLFARIKGLPPASTKEAVKKSLEEVRLTNSAKVRAGSYSGGMRRRLSVASALLGDPKLVILDEPVKYSSNVSQLISLSDFQESFEAFTTDILFELQTTGMDPISRRHVWDIIENAKRGKVVILTTHSMEEADILGDRIGIMAKGRLRCIGTSIRLKSRFGTGFVANLSFVNGNSATNSAHKETVKSFFRHHLAVIPKEESNAFLTFVIPREKEPLLVGTLGELQDRQQEFGVSDIQLGLTTLEEVFLNIARQAELETAAAEGRMETLTLSSGALVQIPVGAKYVAVPGSETADNPQGIMVEVHWEQNDSGALCISGHSAERPVPSNVQPTLPVVHPRSLGQPKGVVGRVIDPSQLSENCFDS
ncbi:ABC transporter A family member 2-like isoform X2 [Chenopodium quinoa]|uniref:ABC transporter A family member 2-like isoform X2 n=1 Tax=Chenopodium quinoa TaxID=63459 RepID=UPI000B798850|nr:ABC transporter A family member 2-like isoform X2 [Chenopodium quinoa]